MISFDSTDDILEFAMDSEQRAIDFYKSLARGTDNQEMKEIFTSYAQDEIRHKAKIMSIKEQGLLADESEAVADMRIEHYATAVRKLEDMTYADALILAMKREKSSYKLYMHLAQRVKDSTLKRIFNQLAQEEAKHKLRFEIEYDEYVLRDN